MLTPLRLCPLTPEMMGGISAHQLGVKLLPLGERHVEYQK